MLAESVGAADAPETSSACMLVYLSAAPAAADVAAALAALSPPLRAAVEADNAAFLARPTEVRLVVARRGPPRAPPAQI